MSKARRALDDIASTTAAVTASIRRNNSTTPPRPAPPQTPWEGSPSGSSSAGAPGSNSTTGTRRSAATSARSATNAATSSRHDDGSALHASLVRLITGHLRTGPVDRGVPHPRTQRHARPGRGFTDHRRFDRAQPHPHRVAARRFRSRPPRRPRPRPRVGHRVAARHGPEPHSRACRPRSPPLPPGSADAATQAEQRPPASSSNNDTTCTSGHRPRPARPPPAAAPTPTPHETAGRSRHAATPTATAHPDPCPNPPTTASARPMSELKAQQESPTHRAENRNLWTTRAGNAPLWTACGTPRFRSTPRQREVLLPAYLAPPGASESYRSRCEYDTIGERRGTAAGEVPVADDCVDDPGARGVDQPV